MDDSDDNQEHIDCISSSRINRISILISLIFFCYFFVFFVELEEFFFFIYTQNHLDLGIPKTVQQTKNINNKKRSFFRVSFNVLIRPAYHEKYTNKIEQSSELCQMILIIA